LIVTGPPELREQLRHLRTLKIIVICARLRPGQQLSDPDQATKTALRRLARRHQQLSEEISDADHEIAQLVGEVAPELLNLLGVGPEVAGQLLTSAGDNPDRITSEPRSLTCAVSPQCRPAAAVSIDTASIEAATAKPTPPSTSW
jgi:transposase